MKLIYKGEKNKRKYEAECSNCGSIFEAEKHELTIETHRNESCVMCEVCPECDNPGLTFKEKQYLRRDREYG